MKRRNVIALAVAAAAVAAAAVWALRPQPITVETAQVVRGVFEQTVSDDGKTRVRDRYVVSAPLAGRVERSRWHAGDPVDKGETVAVLTPAVPAFIDARTQGELEARVAGAEAQRMRAAAELEKAHAQLQHARSELARTEKLAREGFVSANAREDALLALRTAEKAVDAAHFAEEAARYDIAQARAAVVRYRARREADDQDLAAQRRGSAGGGRLVAGRHGGGLSIGCAEGGRAHRSERRSRKEPLAAPKRPALFPYFEPAFSSIGL